VVLGCFGAGLDAEITKEKRQDNFLENAFGSPGSHKPKNSPKFLKNDFFRKKSILKHAFTNNGG
jgi:hypothetical protein